MSDDDFRSLAENPAPARYSRHRPEDDPSNEENAALSAPETAAADLIYGAENIARFMGVSVRKIYYFMERKKEGWCDIPINKIPCIGLCASRRSLVDYLGGDRQAEFRENM